MSRQKPARRPVLRAERRSRRKRTPNGLLARLRRFVLRAVLIAVLLPLVWVLSYRWIDPPGGPYMAAQWLEHGRLARDWRDLDDISASLARAVIAAEDARFCSHFGIDLKALEEALADGAKRGASTVTQQVAKNVFLWHGRSWLRKGLEAGFAVAVETLWDKRRILEVYLNVAEFGTGVFGAEAAARHHFGMSADALSLVQASRLAAVLPDPQRRDPNRLRRGLAARADRIVAGARTVAAERLDACLEPTPPKPMAARSDAAHAGLTRNSVPTTNDQERGQSS